MLNFVTKLKLCDKTLNFVTNFVTVNRLKSDTNSNGFISSQ